MDDLIKSLKDYADTILELKKAGDRQQHVQAAAVAGSVLLLRCREQSRQAALEAERTGEGTVVQRTQLDHDSLQLHNLVYEQQYYDREIASCRAFQSSVPDGQLSCITPAEFQRTSEPTSALTSHDRELARLNYELEQRKQLKAQLLSLQQAKQRAQGELNAAAARIDDLRGFMEGISRSSKPLMDTTLPAAAAVKNNAEAAELLPLPLYIIYSQAATGGGVVGLPLRADIDGSTAAAARFAAEPAANSTAAAAAPQEQPGKRRRKSEAQEQSMFKVHPLSVTIEVCPAPPGAGSSPLMTLTFQYYTQLKLVGVSAGSAEDEEVLTDLFLGDLGDGSLFESVAAAAASSSSSTPLQFGGPGKPRPFKWAQDLAGVDVVPSLPASFTGPEREQLLSGLSAYRSQLRLETLLERLSAAKQGRLALKEILAKLSNKEQPSSSWERGLPGKVSTVIYSWKHLSDAGLPQQRADEALHALEAGSRAQILQLWQPGQQGSLAEEGELAGGAGDGDELRLMPGDTAEEDLLMGLLMDEPMGGTEPVVSRAGGAAEEGQLQGDEEPGMAEQGQASASGSDAASEGAGAVPEVASSSATAAAALLARHSTYRLVLRTSSLEVHLHVRVFSNYPLCPPVFSVTKIMDTSRSKAVPLTAVNEVLRMEQQVNAHAVRVAHGSEVLALQVLLLRQCVEQLSAQLRGDSSRDLVDRLRARQQLRGKDRQGRLMWCA